MTGGLSYGLAVILELIQSSTSRTFHPDPNYSRVREDRVPREEARPLHLVRECALLSSEWIIEREEVVFSESDIVGFGGCACIARGVYRSQPVAVKLLTGDYFTVTATKLLEREAYVMSLISKPRHPNIVQFIGAWFGHSTSSLKYPPPLLVTELLDLDLRQLCEQTHLQRPTALSIFLDIAYGLCYLHQQAEPIVHGDINPTNIFLKSFSGGSIWRAKIGDFGSANLAGTSASLGGGTELYMAPETLPSTVPDTTAQFGGITAKADVFSYGVLLLEVGTGGRQLERETYDTSVERLLSKWPPLHSLVVLCTDQDPNTRPTASQVIDTLEQGLQTSSLSNTD